MDNVVDNEQLRELMIAIKRLIENARAGSLRDANIVYVERIDFDRLNRLAGEMPTCL